jgi:hypothetical protein
MRSRDDSIGEPQDDPGKQCELTDLREAAVPLVARGPHRSSADTD